MTNPCVTGHAHTVEIDWDLDGDYTGTLEDVTDDLLDRTPVMYSYGRDQARALSPMAPGQLTFELCNTEQNYSPDNSSSPIFGDVDLSRPVRSQIFHSSGTVTTAFEGFISDLEIRAERADKSLSITASDFIGHFKETKISTELHFSLKTGEAINHILDAVDWPEAKRNIDTGVTVIRWWWEEGTSVFDAVQRIVNSEGPPAIAYVKGGVFTFRDRHHRFTRTESLTSQATFCVTGAPCDESVPDDCGFSFTEPFEIEYGLKNIINHVEFRVEERRRDPIRTVVWEYNKIVNIATNQTVVLRVNAEGPFEGPFEYEVDQTLGPDGVFTTSRDSGQSMYLRITAFGSAIQYRSLKVLAYQVPVASTTVIIKEDAASMSKHGRHTWPTEAPWVGENDADAIGQVILSEYSERRPIVTMRVVNCDDAHEHQMLTRDVSDRITIRHHELKLDDDFYIERVEHVSRRLGEFDATIFGCEVIREQADNVFQFDVAGRGFNDGVFGAQGLNIPDEVFRFDTANQGFDDGRFAY